ncbi:rRNA-processing protein FCF1 homolog [Neltuma alba]|uniref:rRNA-processing protein FCF1 homolog n=1 Tax=Neltuma alba TaxID=207710 RepID=UPI0010A54276|nr:rRNA-processing protein FCF1 homolog [Prosopis alba]
MGRAKKGPKFAVTKKLVTTKAIKNPYYPSSLFFAHNTELGPPYCVLVDTNFINFSIQNKLDLEKGMMDCLYAKF